MVSDDFDPVKYGVLWQKVQDMDKKIDKLERQMEQLLELANKSKGGFWVTLGIASFIGGIISYMLRDFVK